MLFMNNFDLRFMVPRIVLVLFCVLVVPFLGNESSVAQVSQKPKGSLPGQVMDIPLWKVLPTKHFAILGEGVVKRRRWAIFAFMNDHAGSARYPCIENVTLRYEHRSISITTSEPSCGALAPPSPTPVTTEYVFTKVAGMVVGMTLAPSVARLKMHFSSGSDLDVPTKLLNAGQAKKARIRSFRYLAMGVQRKACLESFEGVSKNDVALFQTSPQECVL